MLLQGLSALLAAVAGFDSESQQPDSRAYPSTTDFHHRLVGAFR